MRIINFIYIVPFRFVHFDGIIILQKIILVICAKYLARTYTKIIQTTIH